MSAFKFSAEQFKDVEIFEKAQRAPRGWRGILEVMDVVEKNSEDSGPMYIIEFRVAETNLEAFPVGTKTSAVFMPQEFKGAAKMFIQKLLEFYSLLAGITPDDPRFEAFKGSVHTMAESALNTKPCPIKGKRIGGWTEDDKKGNKDDDGNLKCYLRFAKA